MNSTGNLQTENAPSSSKTTSHKKNTVNMVDAEEGQDSDEKSEEFPIFQVSNAGFQSKKIEIDVNINGKKAVHYK